MLESLTLDPDELESYRRTTWLVSFMPRDQLPASEWMTRNFKHGANLEAPDFDRFPSPRGRFAFSSSRIPRI